jgi:site-specific DNA-methyltransferase (adenine-specific)
VSKVEHIADGVTLYQGDCMEILPGLPTVDAVVTDPPYGIDATRMTLGSGRKDFHRGEWDKQRPTIHPIIDKGRYACIWGGNYFSDSLSPTNNWLVWHKLNDGLSFSECELAWTNYAPNVRHLSHHWGGEKKGHPTQKPEAVMKWCLSLLPTDAVTVLDPFMGSGTTGVAAVKAGRKFIGIEVEAKYFDIACGRISEALKQPDLFVAAPKLAAGQTSLFTDELR